MASMAVVLAVGASPRGQASRGTPVSMVTWLRRPRVEPGRPVILMSGAFRRSRLGMRMVSSRVSPLLDRARTTSCRGHHAQVAVHGLHRVQEQGRGAGGVEGGHDLAGHDAGFAHPGDDDPALGLITSDPPP